MARRQVCTPTAHTPTKVNMPLTAAAIQAAKPREKAYKLFDQGGLSCWYIPTVGAIGASNTACTGGRSC